MPRLLELPRQVRAEARRDAQSGIDEPRGPRVRDDRIRNGTQGTRQWHRQAVQEPVHHVEGDDVRDARAVGGRPHDQVPAEGHAEGGRALHAEVVQHRVRGALPLGLERRAGQGRVPLAGPVEGDDVEGTGREVGREVDDLLRVAVESVHHDERVRRARGGQLPVNQVRLPSHRGQLPTAIGNRVPGEREALVGLVEGG